MLALGTAGLLAGAVGGLLILIAGIFKISLPGFMSKGHGAFNFVCLLLVLFALMQTKATVATETWIGAGILASALAGGVLFFVILKLRSLRTLLGAAHGVLAAVGLYFLVPASGLF